MRTKGMLRRGRLPAIGLALLTVSAVVTATVLFDQFFPAVTSVPAILTTQCLGSELTRLSEIPIQGTAGIVRFGCGATTPALTATGAGFAVPTFSLSAGYSDSDDDDAFVLYIYPVAKVYAPDQTFCSEGSEGPLPSKGLTSGAVVPFVSTDIGTAWNYCLEYTNAPAAFDGAFVQWSQADS